MEAAVKPFSPLYVGSVVVTLLFDQIDWDIPVAFSPLYVGSVVVTVTVGADRPGGSTFSPLYVGSVVVTVIKTKPKVRLGVFQSPIRRVSGCNSDRYRSDRHTLDLSVPYTSGQWL